MVTLLTLRGTHQLIQGLFPVPWFDYEQEVKRERAGGEAGTLQVLSDLNQACKVGDMIINNSVHLFQLQLIAVKVHNYSMLRIINP